MPFETVAVSTRSNFGAVRAKALRLSPLERARLTNDLFASLGRRRLAEIERAWDEEIGRRVSSFRSGAMPTVPARAVMEDVRREYGWKK
jgi:putative addiction module component (TIGR02574 family)